LSDFGLVKIFLLILAKTVFVKVDALMVLKNVKKIRMRQKIIQYILIKLHIKIGLQHPIKYFSQVTKFRML